MDEFDLAQGHNEDFQAYALFYQRYHREPGSYSGDGCIDCDEPIPLPRKQAVPGCCRCITCQTEFETEVR